MKKRCFTFAFNSARVEAGVTGHIFKQIKVASGLKA